MLQIIHLSDLHLRLGWFEEQGVVLSALFDDIKKLTTRSPRTYLVFSGDIVQAAESAACFNLFAQYFEKKLNDLGIDKSCRIFVPGNHDVSREVVQRKINIYVGMRDTNMSETRFNDAVYTEYGDLMRDKFNNYLDFEKNFAGYGVRDRFCGQGHKLGESVGLYTLNTAILSCAGAKQPNDGGLPIRDEGSLAIETRSLHQWIQETNFDFRIIVMHHPAEDFCVWAKDEISSIIEKHFNLVLLGHVHKPDARYVGVTSGGAVICTSPPLFTAKRENLGYAVVSVDGGLSSVEVCYRQLSLSRSFVNGTYFSGTDDGVVRFKLRPEVIAPAAFEQVTLRILTVNFEMPATCAPAIGRLWTPPVVGEQPETARDATVSGLDASSLAVGEEDSVVFAPPQFGLTVLGRFLVLEGWKKTPGSACLYFLSSDLPNHAAGISLKIRQELDVFGAHDAKVRMLVLDDFDYDNPLNMRKIKSIRSAFPDCKVILLCKLDVSKPAFLETWGAELSEFRILHLWSLTRAQVRTLAEQYVDVSGSRTDTNDLVLRSVENLERLNLHRTPLNIITLFRIADSAVDISPVNRTEMCEQFLFLLFTDFAQLPRYGTKPDLKDSLYALGFFCEFLIKRTNIIFSKNEFFAQVGDYCRDRMLSIEVDLLFFVSF
ncbi:MAG: metallophosphoesterase [Defluviicoccus sp.]